MEDNVAAVATIIAVRVQNNLGGRTNPRQSFQQTKFRLHSFSLINKMFEH